MKYRGIICFFAATVLAVFASVPSLAQYSGGYQELSDSDVTRALREHVSYLSSAGLEGRGAGSEGEKSAADYVRDKFREYGVELLSGESGYLFGISMPDGDTLTSRNVTGFVQGYDKSVYDRYIVVGARLDNLGTNVLNVDGEQQTQIFYGANGNASGIAMMLELARMIQTNDILFRRSVIFIAFGASCQSFAGSWYFLNRSFSDADKIDAMIDLDMVGTGDSGFYAYTSSNADMNMILSKVAAELQPIVPELTSEEPYPSDHRTFYAKEIPSVLFTTGRYREYGTVRDTESIISYGAMERELEYIYSFTKYISNAEHAPLFRQDKLQSRTDDKVYSYEDCDKRPTFMGSADPKAFLLKWVYQYLKYPKQAVSAGIQGRVIVGFTIGKDGNVADVHVVRSADELLDEEAVRVVKASPKWKPAQVKGVNVDCTMTVAVDFRLSKKGKFAIKK